MIYWKPLESPYLATISRSYVSSIGYSLAGKGCNSRLCLMRLREYPSIRIIRCRWFQLCFPRNRCPRLRKRIRLQKPGLMHKGGLKWVHLWIIFRKVSQSCLKRNESVSLIKKGWWQSLRCVKPSYLGEESGQDAVEETRECSEFVSW